MAVSDISNERREELLEKYSKLKDDLNTIDKKYSLSFQPVEMDFPESLGLEKLTFEPMTESQLQALAQLKLQAKYLEKQSELEIKYLSNHNSLVLKFSELEEKQRAKLAELSENCRKQIVALMHKLANNGLFYSSIKNSSQSSLVADCNSAIAEQNTQFQAENDILQAKLDNLQSEYNQNVAALEVQRTAELAQVVQELTESEEKNRISIEKYNNDVEESENRYKANCVRYTQYAQQAENERAIAAARLYAELGESGVVGQKLSEKFNHCKTFFTVLTYDESQFLLNYDSALVAHLQSYYSALVDWIDTFPH